MELKQTLTAEDIMEKEFTALNADASVREAIDLMIGQKVDEIPILDSSGGILCVVGKSCLLKLGVPGYMLMMDKHAFLHSFEPFERLLAHEDDWKIEEVLDRKHYRYVIDLPAVQLVIGFIRDM